MRFVTGSMKLSECFKYSFLHFACLFFLLFLLYPKAGVAQTGKKERARVELSQPGRPGLLRVNHYKGSIRVNGYKGNAVIVKAGYRVDKAGRGMQRITDSSLELSVVEQNNEVTVHTDSYRRTVDLEILVPLEFSLNLQTYDNGEIEVMDVKGEIEVNNTNGPIRLLRVSGYAVCSTVDGDILIKFKEITPEMPMAFTSIEGNIDVTIPPLQSVSLKMKTDHGDIYSDEGLEVVQGNWSRSVINKGGAEILIKTLNGNIYIRR